MTRKISILGATGSIGESTLSLVAECNGLSSDDPRFEIQALTGGRNAARLAEQALQFRPRLAVIADEQSWPEFRDRMKGSGIEIACGPEALCDAATRPSDLIMAAIVGIAGLKPTWAAAGTGAHLALANKESLVCCGRSLVARAMAVGGKVLPVDSEHNAIAQVLDTSQIDKVRRLILTASGGPFRLHSAEALERVTPAEALCHPNWSMGPKITIDSATLANKGLELIEAAYLFDVADIDVILHPQSVIHSMVEYTDGSVLAQMGAPDMRIPISWCLTWPERLTWQASQLDLTRISQLNFTVPDLERFPMLRLAREALVAQGGLPVVFNAANEVAVAAFLKGEIGFTRISRLVETAMTRTQSLARVPLKSDEIRIDDILALDNQVRQELGA